MSILNQLASQFTIYAGVNVLFSGIQIQTASQVILHPSYNPNTYENDIALLQLASPLSMSDSHVKVISSIVFSILFYSLLLFLIDTCEDDFVGPVTMFSSSNQWVLVGLASTGFECARAAYPDFYTCVAAFTSWIQSNTNDSVSILTSSTSTTLNTLYRQLFLLLHFL
jgi:secreted trypsin-like serine protease